METALASNEASVHRDPKRVEIPFARWTQLPAEKKTHYFDLVDREIKENGIVVLAQALTADRCDQYVRLLQYELDHATRIERVMHERRSKRDGGKIYNLPTRHP